MDVAQSYQRIDVVCDCYFPDIVKEQTRRLGELGQCLNFLMTHHFQLILGLTFYTTDIIEIC